MIRKTQRRLLLAPLPPSSPSSSALYSTFPSSSIYSNTSSQKACFLYLLPFGILSKRTPNSSPFFHLPLSTSLFPPLLTVRSGNNRLLVPHLLHQTPHQHAPLQHPTSPTLSLQVAAALQHTLRRLLYYTCPPTHRTFGIIHAHAVHHALLRCFRHDHFSSSKPLAWRLWFSSCRRMV